jgi:hypothetical protein
MGLLSGPKLLGQSKRHLGIPHVAFGNLGYAFCKLFRSSRAKAIATSQVFFQRALFRHDQRSSMGNSINADARPTIQITIGFIWHEDNVAFANAMPMPGDIVCLLVHNMVDASPSRPRIVLLNSLPFLIAPV